MDGYFPVNLYGENFDKPEVVIMWPQCREGMKFPDVLIHNGKYYVRTPSGKFSRAEALQVWTEQEHQSMNNPGIILEV